MRISCSQWRFSLSPIYERKTWKNLNIVIQNFISIFVFRYSPPWSFCAQICTIANVLIANIMFAVKVLTFTHLRKKNLEKFEYRNIDFYFDFRFSIFAHLAFLCSNLYYSERAHCEYHVRSEDSHFHLSTKEKQQNLNIEIQDFISIFFFRYSATWRFCAQFSYYSMRAHCEYHFRSEEFEYRSRIDMPFSKSGELQDLRCSELNLFRSSLVNLRCRSYLPYSKSEELLFLLNSGHFMFRSS